MLSALERRALSSEHQGRLGELGGVYIAAGRIAGMLNDPAPKHPSSSCQHLSHGMSNAQAMLEFQSTWQSNVQERHLAAPSEPVHLPWSADTIQIKQLNPPWLAVVEG